GVESRGEFSQPPTWPGQEPEGLRAALCAVMRIALHGLLTKCVFTDESGIPGV
ncbi:MAG: hypothetical protein QOF58_1300, partial [Pseudonocardiales bacterium]|nr:hypothetical protein [Pseudonocardiales bacterium]